MKNLQIHHQDNLEVMANLPDESVDIILTDPPYLYLKGQKLEKPFDEQKFFSECKRLLTKNGFIVLFGRGESFYRWNTILTDLGFQFKEEIVWNKRRITSPALALGRLHETISIMTKDSGKLNHCTIPYMENKGFDLDRIENDMKRIVSTLKNKNLLKHIEEGLKNNEIEDVFYSAKKDKYKIAYRGNTRNKDVGIATLNSMLRGCKETSIMSDFGVKYKKIHPTQKPVRLLERLLALVVPKEKAARDIVVLDPFGGSFSTMEAVHNMGMQGISCEIDEEYFQAGKQRLVNLK